MPCQRLMSSVAVWLVLYLVSPGCSLVGQSGDTVVETLGSGQLARRSQSHHRSHEAGVRLNSTRQREQDAPVSLEDRKTPLLAKSKAANNSEAVDSPEASKVVAAKPWTRIKESGFAERDLAAEEADSPSSREDDQGDPRGQRGARAEGWDHWAPWVATRALPMVFVVLLFANRSLTQQLQSQHEQAMKERQASKPQEAVKEKLERELSHADNWLQSQFHGSLAKARTVAEELASVMCTESESRQHLAQAHAGAADIRGSSGSRPLDSGVVPFASGQ